MGQTDRQTDGRIATSLNSPYRRRGHVIRTAHVWLSVLTQNIRVYAKVKTDRQHTTRYAMHRAVKRKRQCRMHLTDATARNYLYYQSAQIS